MQLTPIYAPQNIKIVHDLGYDWTGWLQDQTATFPATLEDALTSAHNQWQKDGFTMTKWNIEGNQLQILFDVVPQTSPTLFSKRVKGRLDHHLRELNTPIKFHRRVSFRSLGHNTSDIVKGYLKRQAVKSDYVDPQFKKWLEQFNTADSKIFLNEHERHRHGCYWYNLHIVIVIQDRKHPMTLTETFQKVKDYCFAIADKKDYEIAALSVMPDHVHISLRGNIEHSPETIVLAFMNNLSYVLGYNRCWSYECYAGTFSEYTTQQIGVTSSIKSPWVRS